MDKYSIEKSEPMLQKSAALPRWSVLFLGNSAATRDITTQYIAIQTECFRLEINIMKA